MFAKRLAAGLAAMTTLAAGLAGPSAYAADASFRDVTASTPHADDIEWAASAGISTGWTEADGSRTFRGMDTVKRQDMAAFMRREAKRMDVGDAATWRPADSDWSTFRDVSRSTPHAEDVLWLAHAGISAGWTEADGSRTYRGMDSVKRQDMAAFMHRLARLAARGSDVTPKSFSDVTSSTPHADDIRWLGGSGVSTGYPDGTYRGMVSVYRQDMAAFLHRLDTLKADTPDTPAAAVRQVFPSGEFTFAVKSDGSLWAWGKNGKGQLGVGDTNEHLTPTHVMDDVATVTTDADFSFAVKRDGSLWAWGDNSDGELGVGDRNERHTPTHVMDDVATVHATTDGYGHGSILAVKKDGSLWAWGYNSDGRLGVGDKSNRLKPTHVMDDVATVYATTDGSSTFVARSDGSLWAWGGNSDGQLGVGDKSNRLKPTHVMDDVATYRSGFVVKSDGSLWAWGGNHYGELGVGDRDDRLRPTHVMDDVASVEPDGFNAFAVRRDGSLWVWGYVGDSRGMTIDVKDTQPTPMRMMDDVADIQADAGSICALKRDGSLWTWGYNGNGQPGIGDEKDQRTPVRMMDDVSSFSAGGWSIYALRKDGSLWAWGFNNGDLGVGDTVEHATPAHVLDGVSSYQSGYAVKSDGSLWAWGTYNDYGQLGVGDTDDRLSPVRVM